MSDPIDRPNYFNGQLLTAADLTSEQEYFRQKLKRHNRFLHGRGVVYGLELNLQANLLVVQPGLALDCAGNEILVAQKQMADLPDLIQDLYVVIAYKEYGADNVPVVGGAGDVPGETTQPSRIVEGFALGFSTELPECSLPAGPGQPLTCGEAHPLALGQLLHRRDRWQLNRAFRRKAIASPAKAG